jgi:hypothetical protein
VWNTDKARLVNIGKAYSHQAWPRFHPRLSAFISGPSLPSALPKTPLNPPSPFHSNPTP